jgi:KaiC/GvpD/RAD55 family RecA-like ATPase
MTEDAAPTGIGGLDYLLRGGLPAHRIHLVEGQPGAGKTTLGLQFLIEGVRRGESCMYLTLFETEDELRTGNHETTIRDFGVRKNRLHVGEPLVGFRGVPTGVPELVGATAKAARKS